MLITAHYRIHINGIDLSGSSLRCCGGLGFALQQPVLRLRIDESTADEIDSSYGAEAERLLATVKAVERLQVPVRIKELEAVRPHIGLGSLTQLKLSLLRAVRAYKGQNLDYLSIPVGLRIGATSGIGVGTFLYGGLIVDGGYRLDERNPLNGERVGRPAPIIVRCAMPESWGVLLVIPKTIRSLSGTSEAEFFRSITPTPQTEVREIAYQILLGVLPAIREADFQSFVEAVRRVCGLGTKPHEMKLNPSCIPVLSALESNFGFGGLSSLGPTCYTFFEQASFDHATARALELQFPDFEWVTTAFCNEPHSVVADNGTICEHIHPCAHSGQSSTP